MLVKGTALHANRLFIQNRFGDEAVTRWLDKLPEASRAIVDGSILEGSWYPVADALVTPTHAICDLFFDGNLRHGAREVGRFSADHGLHGIYRVFVRMAPPGVVVGLGTKIIKTYYEPIEMQIVDKSKTSFRLEFAKMDEPSEVIDYRIAGWIERAIQICGNDDIVTDVVASAQDASSASVIVGRWS